MISQRFLLPALLLLASSALVAPGCDSDSGSGGSGGPEASSQAEWSPMPEAQRAAARRILTKFGDEGLADVNVLRIVDIIINEGIRNFAGAYSQTSIVIENEGLELTASTVLPEKDANGFFDPTGGYMQFKEVTHDYDGDKTSDITVTRVVQEFLSGKMSGFDYADTTDNAVGRFIYEHIGAGFKVDSAVSYVEKAWHQQKGTTHSDGVTHSEVYSYQQQPTFEITLSQGDSYTVDNEQADDIVKSQGWTVKTTASTQAKLNGTLTLYRPARTGNNGANTRPELDDGESTVVQNGVEIVTTEVTTLGDNTSLWGMNNELEEYTETRTSTLTETHTEEDTGRVLFKRNETHTTTTVAYYVAEGGTAAAIKNRSFEQVANHEITTRVIKEQDWNYQGNDGSYLKTTDDWTYQYTNNPATRNAVTDWMSTHHRTVDDYDGDDGDTVTTDHGTEWLTSELEADSDFNGVGWSWSGTSSFSNLVESTYFGSSNNGLDTKMTTDVKHNFSASWGGDSVSVSGGFTARGAAIDNGDGLAHAHQGDGDGSFSISFGGTTYNVSAEEWLNAIIP